MAVNAWALASSSQDARSLDSTGGYVLAASLLESSNSRLTTPICQQNDDMTRAPDPFLRKVLLVLLLLLLLLSLSLLLLSQLYIIKHESLATYYLL